MTADYFLDLDAHEQHRTAAALEGGWVADLEGEIAAHNLLMSGLNAEQLSLADQMAAMNESTAG